LVIWGFPSLIPPRLVDGRCVNAKTRAQASHAGHEGNFGDVSVVCGESTAADGATTHTVPTPDPRKAPRLLGITSQAV
jgi:hypothetical protein